jgi:hypothetical protein
MLKGFRERNPLLLLSCILGLVAVLLSPVGDRTLRMAMLKVPPLGMFMAFFTGLGLFLVAAIGFMLLLVPIGERWVKQQLCFLPLVVFAAWRFIALIALVSATRPIMRS